MGVITASRAAMRTDNASQANQSRSSALAQITTYIPSDVVATYVALQGIFTPGTNKLKWALFGIGVGLCVLLPILNYFTAQKIGGGAAAANPGAGAAAANPGAGAVAANPGGGAVAANPGAGAVAANADGGAVAANPDPGAVAANPGAGAVAANADGGGAGTTVASGQATLGKQIIVIALAVVAFTTYAMALPSSVFVSVFKTAGLWGAASALVLALIMPAVAGAFGITSS
jgi:hypothetical protein